MHAFGVDDTLHRFSLPVAGFSCIGRCIPRRHWIETVAEFIALGIVGRLMAYEACFGQLMVSKVVCCAKERYSLQRSWPAYGIGHDLSYFSQIVTNLLLRTVVALNEDAV